MLSYLYIYIYIYRGEVPSYCPLPRLGFRGRSLSSYHHPAVKNIGPITGHPRLSSLYNHTVFALDVKNVLVCHNWFLLYFAHMRTETRGFPEHSSCLRNNSVFNSLDFHWLNGWESYLTPGYFWGS